MPATDNRGAVLNVSPDGVLTVVWWGPDARATVDALDVGGMTVEFLRPPNMGHMVETITRNLKWNDDTFPVTVID